MEQKKPELPGLTPEERALIQKLTSSPIDLSPEFKGWLVSHLEVNPPALPLSQMLGYADLVARIEALENAS